MAKRSSPVFSPSCPCQHYYRSPGSQVTELGSAHGLRGILLSVMARFQAVHATPDGDRLIPGVMWDAAGNVNTLGSTDCRYIADGGGRKQ